ncbi:MAG: Rieske 2Fe-2S domain-containing protein [bacterium]
MYQFVCKWPVLVARKKLSIPIGNRLILVAEVNGVAYAIADKCPHRGFMLSGGKLENGVIRCKEHGLEIDLATGLVRDEVKAAFLRLREEERSVRTYPVKVEGDSVYVDV